MIKSLKLKKSNVPDSKFDKKELLKGIAVEKEHTNDAKIAKAIAKAHLSEDPNYYKKLSKYVEPKKSSRGKK